MMLALSSGVAHTHPGSLRSDAHDIIRNLVSNSAALTEFFQEPFAESRLSRRPNGLARFGHAPPRGLHDSEGAEDLPRLGREPWPTTTVPHASNGPGAVGGPAAMAFLCHRPVVCPHPVLVEVFFSGQ
jgi:hypothetical protein